MHRFALSAILFFLVPFNLSAQTKKVNRQGQAWYDFTENMRVHPRWSVVVNFSERHTFDSVGQTQFVARALFLHHFKSNWSIGAGYAGFWNWQGGIIVPELRPEQWFFYRQQFEKVKWLTVNHRFKLEERFNHKVQGDSLVAGYDFSMRFRYRIGLDFRVFAIGDKHTIRFSASEEILLQAGKQIVYNIFDQNRVIAGFSYNPIPDVGISVAYMHAYRQMRAGNVFNETHNLRIGIEHNLTIKAKSKPNSP